MASRKMGSKRIKYYYCTFAKFKKFYLRDHREFLNFVNINAIDKRSDIQKTRSNGVQLTDGKMIKGRDIKLKSQIKYTITGCHKIHSLERRYDEKNDQKII